MQRNTRRLSRKVQRWKREGPLKGKLVRAVDEESVYCGSFVEVVGHAKDKLHGHAAWKDATIDFWEKTKMPPTVAIAVTAVLPVEEIQKTRVGTLEPTAMQR